MLGCARRNTCDHRSLAGHEVDNDAPTGCTGAGPVDDAGLDSNWSTNVSPSTPTAPSSCATCSRGSSGDPLQLSAARTARPTEPPVPDRPTLPTRPEPHLRRRSSRPNHRRHRRRSLLEVTNYAPLTDPDDVARVVGSDVDPNVFRSIGDAIDGVVIDARPLLAPQRRRHCGPRARHRHRRRRQHRDTTQARRAGHLPAPHPAAARSTDGDEDLIATAGTVVQRIAGAVDADATTAPPIDLAVVTVTPGPPPDADEATLRTRPRHNSTQRSSSRVGHRCAGDARGATHGHRRRGRHASGAERLADALADDELVALPIVPLDVSSAVAAGQADAYTRLLGAGEDLLTDAVPTTPSRRDIWITTDPLSAGGAQLLRDLGTRFIVIPADLYAESIDDDLPPSDLFVEAALPDGGTLPFLVVDPLAEELTEQAADRILARSTAPNGRSQRSPKCSSSRPTTTRQRVRQSTSRPSPPRRSRVLTTPDLESPDARLDRRPRSTRHHDTRRSLLPGVGAHRASPTSSSTATMHRSRSSCRTSPGRPSRPASN